MRRTVEIPGFGKITAEDSTLNEISLWAITTSHTWEEQGAHAISKEAMTASETIYNFLYEKGFYKDIEKKNAE